MKVKLIVAGVLVLGFTAGLFSHFDWNPNLSTYGLSVGTNNTYCSADSVDWTPMVSCERAP